MLCKKFIKKLLVATGGALGKILGAAFGGFVGAGLTYLGQQGIYSYLRDLKECAEQYGLCGASGAPRWAQILTDPNVAKIIPFIGGIVGATIAVLIVEQLLKEEQ
jgi:uncharacterized membrane protein YeaQ/YmgE (transglycosylase-associated protein family)